MEPRGNVVVAMVVYVGCVVCSLAGRRRTEGDLCAEPGMRRCAALHSRWSRRSTVGATLDDHCATAFAECNRALAHPPMFIVAETEHFVDEYIYIYIYI